MSNRPEPARDLTLDRLALDPYSALAPLQAAGGPFWAPKIGMWLVTRYDEVVEVLRDPQRFTNDSEHSTIQRTFGRQMLSVEGAEQRRYKQACLEPFTGKAAREVWQDTVRDHCVTLLDDAVSTRLDLMASYAAPIALDTMGLVVGLPRTDLPRVHRWYAAFAQSLANFTADPEIEAAGQRAAREMKAFLSDLVDGQEARLAAGTGGARQSSTPTQRQTLIAHLASRSEDDPAALRRGEILANLLIVLFGGIETTESLIGNTLWCLFTEPGIADAIRHAEDLEAAVDDLIEESLRYEPAVQTLTRHATEDTELSGRSIRCGETVQCMVSRANRDPDLFEEPDRFRLGRSNVRRHLSFGLGSHFCLGAQLARTETRCALLTLLERHPGVTLELESCSPPYGYEFRKPGALIARLD